MVVVLMAACCDCGPDRPPRRPGQRRTLTALAVETLGLVLDRVYRVSHVRQLTADYRVTVRNFYGALRVRDSGPPSEFDATRTLTHGTINHGEQFLNPARRDLPTTYYGPNTGVGHRDPGEREGPRAIRVGVIGLGTGTLASYGREGDYFRFYEINPLVLRLARTEFTFLNDCKAKLDVSHGRCAPLAREGTGRALRRPGGGRIFQRFDSGPPVDA